jgi:hypothetical protein
MGVADRAAYLSQVDITALRVTQHRMSAPVDYGYE